MSAVDDRAENVIFGRSATSRVVPIAIRASVVRRAPLCRSLNPDFCHRLMGKCTVAGTGREHLLVAKGVPSNGAPSRQEVWRVQSDLRLVRVGQEFRYPGEEPYGFGDFGRAVVSDEGFCRDRELDVVRRARRALFPDDRSSFRNIPAVVVARQLTALGALGEFARIYEASGTVDDGRWTVVLVHLKVECYYEATVLVRDRLRGTWRAVGDVPGAVIDEFASDCSLTNGTAPEAFFPHVMFVEDDRLVMAFKRHVWWGETDFGRAIDLATGKRSDLGPGVMGAAPRWVSEARLRELVEN